MLDMYSPTNFDEFVNQEAAKQEILTLVRSARVQGICAPHMILVGENGTGKKTIARLVAGYMHGAKEYYDENAKNLERPFHEHSGGALSKGYKKILGSLQFKDVLFVDEVHKCRPVIADDLLQVLTRINHMKREGFSPCIA